MLVLKFKLRHVFKKKCSKCKYVKSGYVKLKIDYFIAKNLCLIVFFLNLSAFAKKLDQKIEVYLKIAHIVQYFTISN